ncbi:MAG: NAD-dependent epimerase/dehydratase family protein [bacterium]|nr:NAD-dependent epimerase/dehydratase family protein [bacterium]
MSKILITGSTGFVGKSLIPALLKAGHTIRCAVSKKNAALNAEQIIIDRLERQKDWSQALEGIDVVIHLAARVHIMQEKAEDALNKYCEVNSLATQNLAQQAAEHQVKRFIFLSSIKVNGEFTVKGSPFTEESVTQPEDPYGQSKLYAEQYLQTISQSTNMEVVILRTPLIYGAGVKANFLKMIQLVNKGFPLPFAQVHNKRSFVYIDNLISAINVVIAAPQAANQLYLVADDEALSLPQLLGLISAAMNKQQRLFSVPVNLMAFFFKICGLKHLNIRLLGSLEINNLKIKSELGWVPPVTSRDGLAKTVEWYQRDIKQ